MTVQDIKGKALAIAPAGLVGVMASPALALAEGETSTVKDAVTSMATTVATDGQAALVAILPVLAPLIAAGIVATLGVKFVRRFGK